jgi:hypothetical protein
VGTGYRGAPPPDGLGKPVYDVIAPRRGESFDLTILDSLILGTDCHWVIDPATRQGRSRLCTIMEGDCQHCKGERKLWLGWLAVIDNGRKGRAILRLGRESAVTLTGRAVQFAGLRGLRLKVGRSLDHRTGSLIYEDSPLTAQRPLPEPHALEHTICLCLGCTALPDYRVTAADLKGGVA